MNDLDRKIEKLIVSNLPSNRVIAECIHRHPDRQTPAEIADLLNDPGERITVTASRP
jgi:hypothetical protein